MPRQSTRTNGRSKSEEGKPAVHLLADHSPPQNIPVEQGCLGMVMRDPECLHEVIEILRPEEFFRPDHQTIAQTIWKQYGDGLPCDPLSISEALTVQGLLDQIGGDLYLSEILETAAVATNAGYLAGIVHQKFMARRSIEVGSQMVRRGYSNTSSGDELIEQAESEIFAITDARADSSLTMIGTAVTGALKRLESRREGVAGIPSGIFELDDMTDGWQAGQLIIIGARPSMGKTAIALNLIENATFVADQAVYLASLEMSHLEIAERFISSRTKIGNHRLRQVNRLSGRDMNALGRAYMEFSTLKLWIDDTPTRTALKIAAAARRIKAKQGLGLVVVDYLQLVDGEDGKDSREEKIAKITRRLKVLARELHVPVILLSQLNRGVENREDHRPRMSDLRESGAIEQDADIVILLHRPDYYDPNDLPGIAEFIVAKNRNGATGHVKTTFLKDIGRFENLANVADPIGDTAF